MNRYYISTFDGLISSCYHGSYIRKYVSHHRSVSYPRPTLSPLHHDVVTWLASSTCDVVNAFSAPTAFTDSTTDSRSPLFHYPCPPPHSAPQYLLAQSEVTDRSLHPLGCIWLHAILLCGPQDTSPLLSLLLELFKCLNRIYSGRSYGLWICNHGSGGGGDYVEESE